MQELMLTPKKKSGSTMLDFNAEDYPLGPVIDVVDRTGRRWYQTDASRRPTITNDATVGKVLTLTAAAQLLTPLAGIDVTGSWTLEALFCNTEVASSAIFSTGDYNQGRILGMNLGVNGAADYVQLFVDNGNYVMLHPKGSNVKAWDKVVITRKEGVGYTLEIIRNGASLGVVTAGDFRPGPGSTLAAIGYSVAGSRAMGGMLKSLRIDKL